jgi:hypothetical protein
VITLDRDDLIALWLNDHSGLDESHGGVHRETSRQIKLSAAEGLIVDASEVAAFLREVTTMHGARSLEAVNFVHWLVSDKHCTFTTPNVELPTLESRSDDLRKIRTHLY